MILEAIDKAVHRHDLSCSEAEEVMGVVMSGQATSAQVASLLTALQMKGETAEEITGFASVMRRFATRIVTKRRPLVDTCGTGGDRLGTFNISTAVAFVVAGAGVAVAKHGNRSATSMCGSADVLEALGVRLDVTPEKVGQCIDGIGIGFLFARSLHTAMKHVAPVRQEIRIPTVFNLLGPLTNPADACGQVIGVFDAKWVEPLAHVLRNLGTRHAMVVCGRDGLDEITITGPTFVAEVRETSVQTYEFNPESVGISLGRLEDLKGADAAGNAAIIRAILTGEHGPKRDIVVLNAAAALITGDAASDWKAAIDLAIQSIDSGAAWAKVEALIKATHDS